MSISRSAGLAVYAVRRLSSAWTAAKLHIIKQSSSCRPASRAVESNRLRRRKAERSTAWHVRTKANMWTFKSFLDRSRFGQEFPGKTRCFPAAYRHTACSVHSKPRAPYETEVNCARVKTALLSFGTRHDRLLLDLRAEHREDDTCFDVCDRSSLLQVYRHVLLTPECKL